MSRSIEFEQRDGEVIVWKVWPDAAREEVCRLIPQEALDASSLLREAAANALSATLPPGVR